MCFANSSRTIVRRFRSLPTNALSAYHFKRFLRIAGARSVEFLQFLTRPVTKETLHQHLCQSQEYFAGIKVDGKVQNCVEERTIFFSVPKKNFKLEEQAPF